MCCGQLVTVGRPDFEAKLARRDLPDPSNTELVLRVMYTGHSKTWQAV